MKKVKIISEIGVNHNGDMKLAKRMINLSKKAGADYVKFQMFKTENLITKDAHKTNYQLKNTNKKQSAFSMLKSLELNSRQLYHLYKYSLKKNIKFLTTPFDFESVNELYKMGIKEVKISSADIDNYPLLISIAKKFNTIFLSSGMSNINDIKFALRTIKNNGKKNKKIFILHCNTAYPTPFEDVNLNALKLIKKKFDMEIGYSDHTLGFEVPIAAVSLGATVIEKHFTLNKNMKGPDQKSSIEFKEFKIMVDSIRNIENALGEENKIITKSEKQNVKLVRKSIVAKNYIKKGEIFSSLNLDTKRPALGLSPKIWKKLIGKKAKKNFKKNEFIKL